MQFCYLCNRRFSRITQGKTHCLQGSSESSGTTAGQATDQDPAYSMGNKFIYSSVNNSEVDKTVDLSREGLPRNRRCSKLKIQLRL